MPPEGNCPLLRGSYRRDVGENITDEDVVVIRECLRAAAEGPFFPDWEFSTLIGGMSRIEVGDVLERWSDEANPETQDVAVNDVLNNLLGYPHRRDDVWSDFISVSRGEVAAVLARWRGDTEFDGSGRGYFDRLR
jgi:hypothetical protein